MKKYAIAFGFKGKTYNKINKAWNILEKKNNVKFFSSRAPAPHINIITGNTKNIEKIFIILKNIKIKKFKLNSPGLGVLANNELNLYIRWEQNAKLIKIVNKINKRVSHLFSKIGKYTNSSLWIPMTTIAYKDFGYNNLRSIYNKINFLFKKHSEVINLIYLIDYTNKEIITHKINLK